MKRNEMALIRTMQRFPVYPNDKNNNLSRLYVVVAVNNKYRSFNNISESTISLIHIKRNLTTVSQAEE